MDVATLIEMLKVLPQYAPAKLTYDDGYGCDEIKSVRFDDTRCAVVVSSGADED